MEEAGRRTRASNSKSRASSDRVLNLIRSQCFPPFSPMLWEGHLQTVRVLTDLCDSSRPLRPPIPCQFSWSFPYFPRWPPHSPFHPLPPRDFWLSHFACICRTRPALPVGPFRLFFARIFTKTSIARFTYDPSRSLLFARLFLRSLQLSPSCCRGPAVTALAT